MPRYYFEHCEESAHWDPTEPVNLSTAEDAYAMAMEAAHEAACSVAFDRPSGRVAIIARSEDGAEVARATVTWSLTIAGDDTGRPPSDETDERLETRFG